MALELRNAHGERVTFSGVGAAIVEIFVFDDQGQIGNVAMAAGGSAGRVVGRFANRIANGDLPLDGKTYRLLTNEGTNTLHGGPDGFSKRTWRVEDGATEQSLTFSIDSPDGDQGFPGAVTVRVTYTFDDNSELRIDYEATTSAPTVINLTNHAYFNLTGDPSAPIENVQMQIESDAYLPVDSALIPTGKIVSVDGTDRDFRDVRAIGATAYDVTYVLEGQGLRPAAQAFDARSGRSLAVETTEPAIQLYTGKPGAFALETEHYPDAPHHPNFPVDRIDAGPSVPFDDHLPLLGVVMSAAPPNVKRLGIERFPFAAAVITAVFAIEVMTRSSADVTAAASMLFWGEATTLAPLMQSIGMGNAPSNVVFAALIAILFIVLAFVETALLIILRRTTPRVRWIVRATVTAIAVALLLFTPPAGPMRMF